MTEQRKNEILSSALKLIGTHLDEDENITRALSKHLGMTAEEMRECGIEATDAPKRSVRAKFEQKVNGSLERHKAQWLKLQPGELIERAEEIASFQFMARRSIQRADEDEMTYLLRFKDPLEVLTDMWNDRQGMDIGEDEAVDHILWEIADRRDAESDYEMEPEYYDTGPTIKM